MGGRAVTRRVLRRRKGPSFPAGIRYGRRATYRMGRDVRRGPARAVGHARVQHEAPLAADFHVGDADVPALDDLCAGEGSQVRRSKPASAVA